MKKIIFIIIILINIFYLFSQDVTSIGNELLKLKNSNEINKWITKNQSIISTELLFNLVNYAYNLWYLEGKAEDGIYLCDVISKIGEKSNDPDSTGWSIFQKGTIYLYTGKYDNAKSSFNESNVLFKKAGNIIGEANCHKSLGDIIFNNSKYLDAIKSYNDALSLYKKADSFQGEAVTYYSLGECYYYLGDYVKANEHYDLSLKLNIKIKYAAGEADCYLKKGSIAFYTGYNKEAKDFFEKALAIYQKEGSVIGEANCYKGEADIASTTGENEKAYELYEKALSFYKKAGEILGEANCYKYQADIAIETGKNEKGKELYEKALSIYIKINDQLDQGNCYQKLGLLYSKTGDNKKAVQLLEKALTLYKEINAPSGEATSYQLLGEIYLNYGENDKADDFYEKALSIYIKTNSPYGEANCYLAIGNLTAINSDNIKANDLYEKGLSIYKKINYPLGEASCYQFQANLALTIDDRYLANELYEKALYIYRRLNNPSGEADCYQSQGMIALVNKEDDKAKTLFEKALIIYQGINSTLGEADCFQNLGDLLLKSKNYSKAEELYEKSLTLYKKADNIFGKALCYQKQGDLLLKTFKNERANQLYKESLELLLKHNDPDLISFGYYKIAECNFTKDNNIKLRISSDNIEQSVTWMENAREGAGNMDQKKSFFARRYMIYKKGIDISFYNKEYEKMFYYMEASRARTLLEEISQDAVFQSDEIDKKLIDNLKNIKNKITNLNKNIAFIKKENKSIEEEQRNLFNLNKEYKTCFDEIIMKYPKMKDIVYSRIVTLNETQKILKDDETIIEYSIGNYGFNENYAFIITKKSYKAVVLPASISNLENSIDIFKEILTGPSKNYILKDNKVDRRTAAGKTKDIVIDSQKAMDIINKDLYEMLIEPVIPYLKNKENIIIIPDDILSYLPFEVLKDKDGKYIAETMGISYIQSSSILIFSKQIKSSSKLPFLGFGGAVYNTDFIKNKKLNVKLSENEKKYYLYKLQDLFVQRGSLGDLYKQKGYVWDEIPATEEEVKEIGKMYYNENSNDYKNNIVFGEKVTEERIKEMNSLKYLNKFKIIHFATHGFIDPEIPEFSALVLSQPHTANSTKDDGYLTMVEILNLNLNCDLVNLSACETGLGKLISGEGIAGLTQTFILAGSKNVSVSLWSISDESTKEFMVSFYKKINEGLSYKKAMIETKRDFIKNEKYKHPFFWAPFVIYGGD